MPVTFVSSHARLGGAERYLETLIERLGPGWLSGVVCLEDGPAVERLRQRGVAIEVLPTGRRALAAAWAALKLRRLLRRHRPAVVHANGIKAAVVSVLATRGMGLPVVWVKHDFTGDGRVAQMLAARCRAVIGVSAAVVETFGSKSSDAKVHVVHNGLPAVNADRERGRRLVAEALGLEPTAVIGLVGRLDRDKGQRELVGVLPEIVRRVPEIRVALVGPENPARPEYVAELRSALTREGLTDVVSFLGFREDVLELMSGFDVVVVPSVPDERGLGREGFGFVGLESFAVGTPVVAYDDGALRETLGDCALLVPPGDRAALADALVRVLEDDGLRAGLVRCGRERLEGRFSVEAMVEAMKEHYRQAANTAT
ncbi:MAG: glycosyltransferase family 4 protein [Actinomycetota bacterium]